MAQIQFDLNNEQNKYIRKYMAEQDINSKAEAIKDIITRLAEEQ